MRRYVMLTSWLLLMVFPVALLRRLPPVRPFMDMLIGAEVMHWIAHGILFAGLVILLAHAFHIPLNPKTAAVLLLAVLIVAAAQEGFQLIATKHRPPGWPELFDIGVDLIGAFIGLMLLYLKRGTRLADRIG